MEKMKKNRISIVAIFSIVTSFCFSNDVPVQNDVKSPEIEQNDVIEQSDGSFALVHYNIDTTIVDSFKVEQLEITLDSIECKMEKLEKQTESTKNENEMNSMEKQIISTIVALFILVSIWNRKRKKNSNHG
jgi:hypothetical protein